jgi:hypothetical protein
MPGACAASPRGHRGEGRKQSALVSSGLTCAAVRHQSPTGFAGLVTGFADAAGATSGSVTDIYLPMWSARHLPAVHLPLLTLIVAARANPAPQPRRERAAAPARRATGVRAPRQRRGAAVADAVPPHERLNQGVIRADAAQLLRTTICPSEVACRNSAPCTGLWLLTRPHGSGQRHLGRC